MNVFDQEPAVQFSTIDGPPAGGLEFQNSFRGVEQTSLSGRRDRAESLRLLDRFWGR